MNNNLNDNSANSEEIYCEESATKIRFGNKLFRATLVTVIAVLFAVFVYLLLYFCENTGA